MKVFKKTALLLTVIVLAVVLSIGVIAGVAQAAEGNATLGEVYSGVQVTTDGKVNLKVFYSELGSATGFNVEVVDPVTGKTDKAMNNVVAEASGDKYVVKVPLTPSQMTHTVKVTAIAGDAASTAMEFSVADYAQEVLATEAFAEYHDAMRMLLNWGAMAQNYFGDATSVLANTNAFAKGTNPVGVVNAAAIGAAQVGSGSENFKSATLVLGSGAISMTFYVEVADGVVIEDIEAYYTREDNDTKNYLTAVHVGGNVYSFTIGNISVQNWDKEYTVSVDDFEDVYEYTYSPFNYFTYMLTDGNTLSDETAITAEQKNVVRSMYQFYQAATGNTGAETCAHGNRSTLYWIADGAESATVKCAMCHAELSHQAINNGVNDYIPGSLLQFGSQTGSADVTVMSEDGVKFVRVDNFWGNRDNWGDIGLTNVLTSNTVTGQYMVIKYRVGAEGNAATYIQGYANTNLGSEKNLIGEGEFAIAHGAKNEWITAVIDLSTRVKDPSVAFVPAENGSYDVQYISFRLVPYAAQTVENDSAAGRYLYTYTYTEGGTAKYEYFQNTKLTEEQLAEKVAEHPDYELYRIGKQNISEDAYVDVAYVAFADSMADIKTLIDTETYTVSVSKSANEIYNTADDSCAHPSCDSKEYIEGNTYSYAKCAQCGECLISRTLEDSVKLYFSPYKISKTGTGDPTNARVHYNLANKAFTIDNEAYFSFTGNDNYAQFIWNRTGFSAEQAYTMDIGLANYAVIKMRLSGTPAKNIKLYYGTAGARTDTTLPVAASTTGKWATYVIDLAKVFGEYHVLNAESNTYKIDNLYLDGGLLESTTKVDVAYIAFVEGDLAEVAKLVDTDTALLQTANKGAATVVSGETGKCVGECVNTVQVIDGVYKTACSACGTVVRDHGVKADAVNGYWSAEYLYTCLTKTGTSESKWSSITGQYHQKEFLTEDGETFIRIGDAETNHADNGPWVGWFIGSSDGKTGVPGAGRYMVMKVRQNDNSVNNTSLSMYITSKEGFSTWATGSTPVSLPEDNQWHTIVVDLAARSADYKPTADTGVYDLATFHIRPFGGGSALDNTTDEVMDLAYIAFFDDLADLKDIIKEDSFEFSKSGTSSAILETATGACKYHTPTYVADAADARGYHYECAECGTKLAMDYYTSGKGGVWYYNSGQYAGTHTLMTDPEGFQYKSFLSTGTTGTFFDYNTNTGNGGGVSDNAVRAGRYLVVKLKGDTAATVKFHVGTDNIPKSNNNYVGGSLGVLTVDTMPKEWTVAVIDLTGLANYSMGGTHKIFFSSTTGGGEVVATGAQVDIAYMMLVNELSDIAGLTAGENVQYYGNTFNNAPIGFDELCDGTRHTYDFATATESGVTTNTATCVVCGATKVQTVSADINWFASLSGMGNFQHTLTKGLLDAEEGVMFNRYTGTGGNHLNLTHTDGGAGSPTSGTFPTGKYVAIKYRLWVEGGTGTFGFNAATGDKKDGNGESMGTLDYRSINQGEWRVAFMDVSGNPEWTSDGTAQSIYMMITTGGSGAYTFDVAWVAVVDSVEEMRTLLTSGETYYDVGNDWSKQDKHLNYDGTCVTHYATESVSGNTYTYTCSACGTTVKTIELDSSVTKYYSANTLNTTAKVYYGGSGNAYRYDAAANVGYMETSRIQTIWQRMDHDMQGTQTAADSEQYTEKVGNAKYLVIKARSSDEAACIRLQISTTAKNCQVGTITEADFTDGVLSESKASYHKIVENGQTVSGIKCTAVGDQYYHGSSMKSIYLMGKGEATGEWTTYVIDLEAVCGEYYAKVEGQDYYDVDTFYFDNAGTSDIAYAAFVEGSWAEIDALVDEDVVTQITAGGTSSATVGKLVNVADGSDAQ